MSHLYLAGAGGKHHWTVLGGVCVVIGAGLLGGAAKTVSAWFPTARMNDRRRSSYRVIGAAAAVLGIGLFVLGLTVG